MLAAYLKNRCIRFIVLCSCTTRRAQPPGQVSRDCTGAACPHTQSDISHLSDAKLSWYRMTGPDSSEYGLSCACLCPSGRPTTRTIEYGKACSGRGVERLPHQARPGQRSEGNVGQVDARGDRETRQERRDRRGHRATLSPDSDLYFTRPRITLCRTSGNCGS